MARGRSTIGLVAAGLVVAGVGVLPVAAGAAEPLAEVQFEKEAIRWKPLARYERYELTVSGKALHRVSPFTAEEPPVFELGDKENKVPDGRYDWELRAWPRVPPSTRYWMEKVAEDPNRGIAGAERKVPELGAAGFEAGSFLVRDGVIVPPDEREPEPQMRPEGPRKIDGDLQVSGDLLVEGKKSFVESDPRAARRSIVYVALEGPEAGTYFRGTAATVAGEAVIELPGHFAQVTETAGLTVQLTPLDGWSRLYVVEKTPARLVVHEAAGGDGVAFDFLIQGVRKGFASHAPEQAADAD